MRMPGKRTRGLIAAIPLLCAGCVSAWWNAFIDPTQLGNFRENVVNEIQQTISFRDKPSGIPNAVDPTPDDLVAVVEEYEIGPGDVVQIRMLDFLARDAESEFVLTVDELGFIDVPQLGSIRAEGLSSLELRAELVHGAQDAGIYREDVEPTVTVTFLAQQHRLFNASGTVAAPGVYRIARPDFRLREAINLAGGLDEAVKTIYVFRGAKREKQVRDRGEPYRTRSLPEGQEAPAPPVTPGEGSAVMGGPVPAADEAGGVPQPTTRTGKDHGGLALPAEEVDRDLIDALAPETGVEGPGSRQGQPATVPGDTGLQVSPDMPPTIFWNYENDRFIETPMPAAQETMPAPPATPEQVQPPAEPVDWQGLASEGQQRIIRIPAERLRNGDSDYNIVIRHQDWIRLDPGPVGVYYVGGHVVRPGPFALTGEEITLTQVVFAAGGLDPYAWPTRCEIRRRIDHDREEITQWDLARIIEGKDPDLFIKRNDVINVGTHAIAPILAQIRNSFRMTWGFGFVYDRNFADIDTTYGQPNPRYRRRQEQAARFPGL